MNERIKELAIEAGYNPLWDTKADREEYFDKEKFAELIVQDCIATVEGMEPGYKDYRDQIEDAFRRDCVAEIKHKFGVEE